MRAFQDESGELAMVRKHIVHGGPDPEWLRREQALLGTMIDKSSPFREGPVYLGHPALHYGQAFLGVIGALFGEEVGNLGAASVSQEIETPADDLVI